MKSYWLAWGGGLVVVGAALALVSLPIGLLVGLAGLAFIAFESMKRSQASRPAWDDGAVSPQDRVYLVPIRKLQKEIREIVDRHSDSTTLKVIGAEALAEADRIVDQAVGLLVAARDAKHALQGKAEAERDVADLQNRIAGSTSEDERATLQRALEARQTEIGRYGDLDKNLSNIYSYLRQAEAALAEAKARMVLAATAAPTSGEPDGDLRETLGRLQALSQSLGESQAMLEEKNT